MKMTRGKQQILFNYLPGKTFDFDKSNILAPNHINSWNTEERCEREFSVEGD